MCIRVRAAVALRNPSSYSVLAFGKNVIVAKGQTTPKPSDLVVNDLLTLRGYGTTDLADEAFLRRIGYKQ